MTGERLRTYSGFPNQLTSARRSPDETQILATSIDGTAYVVDAVTGSITSIYTADVPLLSADWSPYGGQVAIGAPLSTESTPPISGIEINAVQLPLQIVVPDPSPKRLQAIAEACDAPPQVVQAITQTNADVPDTLSAVVERPRPASSPPN